MFDEEEESSIYNHRAVVEKKQEFEEVEATSEYRETNYYRKIDDDFSNLVRLNQYWCDYAHHLIAGNSGPFLSSNFTECGENERASFFVLCTLDLQMSNPNNH